MTMGGMVEQRLSQRYRRHAQPGRLAKARGRRRHQVNMMEVAIGRNCGA